MIEGKNIILRLYKNEEDCRTYISQRNNLALRGPADHRELESPHDFLKQFRETGFWGWDASCGRMLITDKKDTILGDIGYYKKGVTDFSLGYGLLRPEYRRMGYMTEAVRLFTPFLFDMFGTLVRVGLYTTPDNPASQGVAEKCGFIKEGRLRKACNHKGEFVDFILYSMLREECPDFDTALARVKSGP